MPSHTNDRKLSALATTSDERISFTYGLRYSTSRIALRSGRQSVNVYHTYSAYRALWKILRQSSLKSRLVFLLVADLHTKEFRKSSKQKPPNGSSGDHHKAARQPLGKVKNSAKFQKLPNSTTEGTKEPHHNHTRTSYRTRRMENSTVEMK